MGYADSDKCSVPGYPSLFFQRYLFLMTCNAIDKSLIVWELQYQQGNYGVAKRALRGHNHFVSDVVMSADGQFAISGSWDKTLRLWNLTTGQTARHFTGHTGDVLSVAFSADSRQIVSGSRDRTAKLWNTLGLCKYTFDTEGHTDWVSCVRFSPSVDTPLIVSCGWDKVVKVWNQRNCKLRTDHVGHTGYLNTIWNLEDKIQVAKLQVETFTNSDGIKKTKAPECTCLAWSADGQTLFAGYTDNRIHVWQYAQTAN
ncbi:unnamed protein product [Dibothriocephalus latus]|uniref:Small ribosomal subunit protein RACK1 n=1 Tax=Dibothriocephalus latus TaxID=60516 RepID=A0A3P7N9G9_DIBLA|nr:unnamed protein product [Dibothriocephalus latus]